MSIRHPSSRRLVGWSSVGAAAFFAASLALTGAAFGQSYSTTFDEGTYTARGSLSGQNGWDTNDAARASTAEDVGQSDYVGPITYQTGSNTGKFSGYQGALGGLYHGTTAPTNTTASELPGSPIVYLFHAFSPGNASSYALNTDLDISYSATSASPTRDAFGFNFQTSGLGNLFSLNFTPDASNASQMVIGYTVNGVQTIPANASAILYNSVYHLQISVNVAAKSLTASFTGTNSFTLSNISLASINPAAVQQVATTWTLTNTSGVDANGGYTNAGSNAIIFDNFALTVPEPSTWAMFGLGATALVIFLRRRIPA